MGRPFTDVTMSPGPRSTPFQNDFCGSASARRTMRQPRKRPLTNTGSVSTWLRKAPRPCDKVARTAARGRWPGRGVGSASALGLELVGAAAAGGRPADDEAAPPPEQADSARSAMVNEERMKVIPADSP